VDTAIDKAHETEEKLGKSPNIDLAYWRGAAQYETANPGEGSMWQMANANSRFVADALESEGYTISFNFGGLKSLDSRS
jgi:hypothetical protein